MLVDHARAVLQQPIASENAVDVVVRAPTLDHFENAHEVAEFELNLIFQFSFSQMEEEFLERRNSRFLPLRKGDLFRVLLLSLRPSLDLLFAWMLESGNFHRLSFQGLFLFASHVGQEDFPHVHGLFLERLEKGSLGRGVLGLLDFVCDEGLVVIDGDLEVAGVFLVQFRGLLIFVLAHVFGDNLEPVVLGN